MSPENEVVIRDIVGSIRQLYRAVYIGSSKISRRFGLTAPQSGVLRTLSRHGPLSSAELSRKLYVTPSNMTGIIDRLEKKGLVKRIGKPGDRRVTLISLSGEGVELSKVVPDPIERKLISGLGDLDPGEVRTLQEGMNMIIDMIDAEKIGDDAI